jgi:hypothetical protein
MLATRTEEASTQRDSPSARHRSLWDVPWVWAAYLVGVVVAALLAVPSSDDLARGAGQATAEGRASYVVLAVVVMLVGAGVAMYRWWSLPQLRRPIGVAVQLLMGTALAAVAGLTTAAILSVISSWQYAQLPPPVDTSFMQIIIGFQLVLVGLALLVYLVTLRVVMGSRKSRPRDGQSRGG